MPDPRFWGEETDLSSKLIPSRLIAQQQSGKARSRALKKMLEIHPVIPAIKNPKTGKVTRGLPGEVHLDVIEREARNRGINPIENPVAVDNIIDEYFQPKPGGKPGEFDEGTGFASSRTGKYLTREEASAKIGTPVGEAMQIHKALTKQPLIERLAETRRGADPEIAARLLAKRNQVQGILGKLNDSISTASDGGTLAKLLNRRGLVRSIARKSGYLGIALTAGQSIKDLFSNNEGTQ